MIAVVESGKSQCCHAAMLANEMLIHRIADDATHMGPRETMLVFYDRIAEMKRTSVIEKEKRRVEKEKRSTR